MHHELCFSRISWCNFHFLCIIHTEGKTNETLIASAKKCWIFKIYQMSYSKTKDLISCGWVSKRVRRISHDSTLWVTANLEKKIVKTELLEMILGKGCRTLNLRHSNIVGSLSSNTKSQLSWTFVIVIKTMMIHSHWQILGNSWILLWKENSIARFPVFVWISKPSTDQLIQGRIRLVCT